MALFSLDIITPDRVAFSDEVEMVVVPGVSGQLGILPFHTKLFTQLSEGEVKIIQQHEEIFLAIGGGFMEVAENKVLILVTRVVHADEINEQEVLAAKEQAEKILRSKPTGEALEAAHAAWQRSILELRLLRRRKKVHS